MRTADFDFALPPELIAQTPAATRDGSRLLVVDRSSGRVSHEQFTSLAQHLRAGDLLVLNDQVFRNPAERTREEKLSWLKQFAKSA